MLMCVNDTGYCGRCDNGCFVSVHVCGVEAVPVGNVSWFFSFTCLIKCRRPFWTCPIPYLRSTTILLDNWRVFVEKYPIAGNFPMVQIFAYFEHVQIVRKLEPMKILARDYPILSHTAMFRLLWHSRCPCKYGSRVSLPWWWKDARTMIRKLRISPTCVPGVWLEGHGKFKSSKIRTLKFNSDGNFEIIQKFAPTEVSHYMVCI